MRTMKELAQEAIDVQDACNLSGVVHAFSRAMTCLCEMGMGTNERNTHPIAVLFSDKIASLTGSAAGLAFSDAYGWAQEQASFTEK